MKNFLSLFLLFFALNIFSQREADFWYFGNNAGLKFSSGEPEALTDGLLSTDEGCSTISDKDGGLLFYTDGIVLYNKNHEIVKFANGTLANNLAGNSSSTQSALFVPNPVDENIYYLFTVGTDRIVPGDSPNPGFNYYTLDKISGEIIAGPVNLADFLSSAWSEKVTAVEGDDCDTIWIVSAVRDQFYSYKITGSGVDATPVISTTNYLLRDKRGYLKISPDGTKLAMADFNSNNQNNNGSGTLVLYDFDTKNGKISSSVKELINPNSDGAPYGVEFSQNSSKLYTTTFNATNNVVYQFDLTNSNVASTKKQIFSQTGFRGALQLASDGKIYISIPGKSTLDVIENPNAKATNINYKQAEISLGGKIATEGLPPFIQSFFSPVNIVDTRDNRITLSDNKQELCIDETLRIEPELQGDSTTTYLWTKEGNSSVNSTNRVFSIDNTNFGSGIYYLEMLIRDSCGREKIFNSSIEVEFIPLPSINTIEVYEQCDYDSNSVDGFTFFNLESKETQLSGGATDVIVEFFEDDDTPITNKVGYINRNAANVTNHVIKLKITNTITGCFQMGEMELKVTPTSGSFESFDNIYESEINISTSPQIISEGSNDAVFNFENKINDIILESRSTFNRTDNQFSFYLSRDDAEKEINRIEPPYRFTNNTDVFVRISKNNTCEGIGQFKLIVLEIPEPMGNMNPIILCIKFPDNLPVLETKPLDGNTSIPTDTYKWYLNNNLIVGETNPILNASKEGTYKVEASRFYGNDPGTLDDVTIIGYNTFTIKESSVATIESFNLVDDQDLLEQNELTVKVKGIGNYEYAINSDAISNFKKGEENLSYTFTNVKPGLNTVYVRDINECGIVASKEQSFVYFQRHFSPNEDGTLDRWGIVGIDNAFYKSVNIKIFDRYGKFLKEINQKTENGWNGTLNGKIMPSDDYWYNAILIDKDGNVRRKTGNFSLVRK